MDNGTVPRAVDAGPLPDRIVDELRELVAVEQTEHDRLTTALAEVRERRDRYQDALEALTGERRPAKPPRPKGPASRDQADWSVSEEKIAEVERLFRKRIAETGQPMAAGTLAGGVPGLSPETARRALNALREREVVRLVGSGRGGGKLFALMPGNHDAT